MSSLEILDEAGVLLARDNRIEWIDDDGEKRIGYTNSLLEQLEDSISSTGAIGLSGFRSNDKSVAPLNLGALDLFDHIKKNIKSIEREYNVRSSDSVDVCDRVISLCVSARSWDRDSVRAVSERFNSWITAITEILNPLSIEIEGACPNCGAAHVMFALDDDIFTQSALRANYDYAKCSSCHTQYGLYELGLLLRSETRVQ